MTSTAQVHTTNKIAAKTDPLLVKAWKALSAYALATGTIICVLDENYLPIPEMFGEVVSEKNTCLYCSKYQNYTTTVTKVQDLSSTPCTLMHINAIKKAFHFKGSCIYMCDLGFMFWTSPLLRNGHFVGALVGSGFLGIDGRKTSEAMYAMSNGKVSEEELKRRLSAFPMGKSEQIKGLAELLLIYAESLSEGKECYHETLKRRAQQQTGISEQISKLKQQYPDRTEAPGYPLDKERMLLAALRRGDNQTGKNILNELLGCLFFSNPDEFRYIQCRAMELAVLLSRAAISPGNSEPFLLETNNHYLQQIQDVHSIEELTDVLHNIVKNIAGQIFSFQGIRHAAALRKAERFIGENFSRKISLPEIAAISGLSAPYFSTIFKEEMGENLSSYLNRLRVEKAGRMLLETHLSLSEIAGSCGFEDQSWFSKIFKSYTGVSPGKYRGQGGSTIPEISEINFSENYRDTIIGHPQGDCFVDRSQGI
jgi:AraC-like DNA-binding protein/ligand-binding sensor protein